jgi:hypothetical protein
MSKISFKKPGRIIIEGNNILINNQNKNVGQSVERDPIFEFHESLPQIQVFEDDILTRKYKIETLATNPSLEGQFLHASIRILPNSALMIDGIISADGATFPKWDERSYEAIRFQPFYLSNANENNLALKGKGLFERGLHYSGTVTPSAVRCICTCDYCSESFTIQHFNAGFSEVQYFYSTNSRETIIVPYDSLQDMPVQLQKEIDPLALREAEAIPSNGDGLFKYYNSFKCPHCFAPFIDFANRESRPKEYYGNTYINQKPVWFAFLII